MGLKPTDKRKFLEHFMHHEGKITLQAPTGNANWSYHIAYRITGKHMFVDGVRPFEHEYHFYANPETIQDWQADRYRPMMQAHDLEPLAYKRVQEWYSNSHNVQIMSIDDPINIVEEV